MFYYDSTQLIYSNEGVLAPWHFNKDAKMRIISKKFSEYLFKFWVYLKVHKITISSAEVTWIHLYLLLCPVPPTDSHLAKSCPL